MTNRYDYDLLKEVIKDRHATNSGDLKCWICTKLVDIEVMKKFVKCKSFRFGFQFELALDIPSCSKIWVGKASSDNL